jgi:uncharacterized protein
MEKSIDHNQIIEKINILLDNYHSDLSYCHGADHCRRVSKLAVKIGEREGADCEIIEVAALLHDFGTVPLAWARHASGKDDYDFQEFLGSYALPSANHGEVGAFIAEQFLKQTGYPETKTKQVAMIIREHNSRNQTTLESRVVSDADRLEALGATWVARAFQRTNAFDRRISIESIPQKYLEGRKSFLDDIYTESVKEIAIQRYRFLNDFIIQFKKEMDFKA